MFGRLTQKDLVAIQRFALVLRDSSLDLSVAQAMERCGTSDLPQLQRAIDAFRLKINRVIEVCVTHPEETWTIYEEFAEVVGAARGFRDVVSPSAVPSEKILRKCRKFVPVPTSDFLYEL